jgi:hypothetical protein
MKYDYSTDKQGWVKYKNGTKVKLRKYVSDLANNASKVNNVLPNINREFIIKTYNESGLEGVILWIKSLRKHEDDFVEKILDDSPNEIKK